jgi:hypothetical protein
VNAFSFRHRWLCGAGLAALLALCSPAIHPFGSVKRSESKAVLASDLHLSPQVAFIVKRSCLDCHSNSTVWPWYSYVAPMSWLVERDVSHGRDHMNFSRWDQYTFKEQERLLADIASAVKNREMPLRQYTLVHRHAKLSDADRDILYGWARAERRRVKSKLAVLTKSAGQRTAGY